ncbi:MAG: UPF0175 family protein [Bacteroidia bacterium]
MALQTIQINLPSDILLTINESENELIKRIKFSLALQLYLQERVTIGKAAQIAEMNRLDFETSLSEYQIPISLLEAEDVLDDMKKLD